MIIFLCWWDWNTCEARETFIKVHEFAREPIGKDLAEIVMNVLINEFGFKQNQIVSAMDGASVMLGKFRGMSSSEVFLSILFLS